METPQNPLQIPFTPPSPQQTVSQWKRTGKDGADRQISKVLERGLSK